MSVERTQGKSQVFDRRLIVGCWEDQSLPKARRDELGSADRCAHQEAIKRLLFIFRCKWKDVQRAEKKGVFLV